MNLREIRHILLTRSARRIAAFCGAATAIALLAAAVVYIRDARQRDGAIRAVLEKTAAEETRASALLPTDAMECDAAAASKLDSLFTPLYVERGPYTDCSFTAAFMLASAHDRRFPHKVLAPLDSGDYEVRLPGMPGPILVTGEMLGRHLDAIRTETGASSRWKRSYTPPGVEIIRCGYYHYQRSTRLREPAFAVYRGGDPLLDLLMMTGIRRGVVISADTPYDAGLARDRRTFTSCAERRGEYVVIDVAVQKRMEAAPEELGNPLDSFGDLGDYFVVAATANRLPRLRMLSLIPNHAYYLMGAAGDGWYVLGDSYHTLKPVAMRTSEFLDLCKAVYLVKVR